MNIKSSVYPAAIAAAVIGLAIYALGWLQFSISLEPIRPGTVLPEMESPPPRSTATTEQTEAIAPAKTTPATKVDQTPTAVATSPGALRISNQTDQPVRVALLSRKSTSSNHNEPIHWDFAPSEGSSQGLMLSLPNGNLKLAAGDVLVAFAQDGSGRYWGPYVVGESSAPVQHQQTGEWQLILQP